MKRLVSLLVAVCVIAACLPTMLVSATTEYPNTHVNTGDMAADIVAVAETQVGYEETDENKTKYGEWYDNNVDNSGVSNAAWAAAFVSWCANQAGISDDIVYYHAYYPYGVNWFNNQGRFESAVSRGGSYVPKAGDIVYFAPQDSEIASHIGIVRYVKDGYVYTIEGNTYGQSGEQWREGVYAKQYSLSYMRLYGYATPSYTTVVLPDDTLVSEELTVQNGVVGGMTPGTIATLKTKLSSGYTMTVRDDNGTLADDAAVKTGQRIDIIDGDTLIASYVIAVNGDYNGDGGVSTMDVRDILCAVSTNELPTKAQRIAMGKPVDSTLGTADARTLLRTLIGA